MRFERDFIQMPHDAPVCLIEIAVFLYRTSLPISNGKCLLSSVAWSPVTDVSSNAADFLSSKRPQ
jgi:hypothetical protein